MKYSYVKTKDAVGMVIPHDVTRIVKGVSKGAAFKKGHVITEEDVPMLLSLGKEHIYSLELEPGDVHEDEAGWLIARAAAGTGVDCYKASEGRVDFYASCSGLLKINVKGLQELNTIPEVILASMHTNTPVTQGKKLAGTRVIPLIVTEDNVQEALSTCKKYGPVLEVKPYLPYAIKVIITGKEVYQGTIQDGFAPVFKEKAAGFNLEEPEIHYAPDDAEVISQKIKELAGSYTIIVVTGGMSVDPDDVTPKGIRMSGAKIEKYGAPVLPGAMFMVAYHEETPVLGMPACGMFFNTTVFDLVFPRLLAGETISAKDMAALGHGGLCLGCENCCFPACSFGKGGLTFGC